MAREPCDAFAALLMQLRKSRRTSARALSRSLGLSESYIYKWEHEPERRVSRKVLEDTLTQLGGSDAERRELFRLADLRDAPDTAKHLYESPSTADPDRNLLHALLEIEHDWPSEPERPNPHSERAQLLLDTAAWIISRVAAHHTTALRPFADIRWPQPLIRVGIVPVAESSSAIAIPGALIQEEMPFVHRLKAPVTPKDAHTQSLGMARTYRRLLFADLDRARVVVAPIQRWSHDRTQDLAECLSITFKTTDVEERAGFQDVGCGVATTVACRELACYLWIMGNALPADKPPARWFTVPKAIDTAAINALATVLPARLKSYEVGQNLRDALFVVRSPTWPTVQGELCSRTGHGYRGNPVLEDRLRAEPLAHDPDFFKDPWQLATVPQELLVARLRAGLAFVPPAGSTASEQSGMPRPNGRSDLERRMAQGEGKSKRRTATVASGSRIKVKPACKKTAKRKGKKR